MRIVARMLLATLLCVGLLRAGTIQVAAAISLKEAVTEAAAKYSSSHSDSINFTFGASGTLLEQIKGGAPIDLFVSAAPEQMDDLQSAGLIDEQTRRDIARNQIVLIVSAESKLSDVKFEQLTRDDVKRVAIGAPKVVPAGSYAMQCLQHLKIADALAPKLVYGANVRQVLTYVETGDVSAGLVYATDAKEAGDKVHVVAIADAAWHAPIVYPAAVLKRASDPAAAKQFLEYLSSTDVEKLLASHGFESASPPSATQP